LEKEFFSSLNFFTKSNISLAQLFWLSSIEDIKDRIMYVSANFEISDSLLNSLSTEKVFILHTLILQDGLKSEEINKTLNYSFNETRLLLQIMLEDGIIIKTDEMYYINPLLYRQTIALLKSKNYLD
jgi:transcription initiation factor IIE alpha subunit